MERHLPITFSVFGLSGCENGRQDRSENISETGTANALAPELWNENIECALAGGVNSQGGEVQEPFFSFSRPNLVAKPICFPGGRSFPVTKDVIILRYVPNFLG